MFPRFLAAVGAVALFAFAVPTAAPAQAAGTMAGSLADHQNLETDPPVLGWSLTGMIGTVGPNESFTQTGGGPWPLPLGNFVPGGAQDVAIHRRSGAYVSGLVPLCVTSYRFTIVDILFLDGSHYVYVDSSVSTRCSNGSRTESFTRYQSAGISPPGTLPWARMQQQRRRLGITDDFMQLCVAPSGATADFRNRGGVPVVTHGPLEFAFAPGAVLDLRQNRASSGPLFVTDAPALLRCDTVLMDPGVQIGDLFSLPPVVLPAQPFADFALFAPGYDSAADTTTFPLNAIVLNTGNVDQQLNLSWNGPATQPAQQMIALPAGAAHHFAVPAAVPVTVQPGGASSLQIQAASLTAPQLQQVQNAIVAREHRGQFHYGTGTPGNSGPLAIAGSAPLAAGAPPMSLTTTGADAGTAGLLMLGVPLGFTYGSWTIPGLGAELYIDPQGPLFVTAFVVADAAGAVTFPLAMPANPSLRGLRIDAQGTFLTSVQAPYRLSSTPALSMAVQ